MYYTKYRPQKFSEISKPNDVATALSNQVKSEKTVHAYLFVGPRGTGKTTTARILAKALNCSMIKDGDPCGDCDACLAIKSGSFLDLIEIDAASNRGIDDIRDLKEKIKLAPSSGKNKVYIIDEVHMLTPEAFNALLKTLEEPPSHVAFILCTTELHKVPETIKSRCQLFKFKRASIDQLVEKLAAIAKKEGLEVVEQDLRQIANASHGGFRDAETLLQQVGEGEVSVEALISVASKETFVDFTQELINKNAVEALHIVQKLYDDGIDLYIWLGELLKYLRELMFLQAGVGKDTLDLSEDLLEKVENQANSVSDVELATILDALIKAQNELKNSFIVQLPLEIAIVTLCSKSFRASPQASTESTPTAPAGEDSRPEAGSPKKPIADSKNLKSEDSGKSPSSEVAAPKTKAVPGVVSVEVVANIWGSVISEVSQINNTISALLKAAKVFDMDGQYILVEVPFDFHKERLESTKNRKVVEDTASSILETEVYIKCIVKKQDRPKKTGTTGKLTDYNVMVPSGSPAPEMNDNILNVFDGGLPLE